MKYWKRGNQVGSMDENGLVPGSEPATKEEYDDFVALQKISPKLSLIEVLFRKGIICDADFL